VKQGFDPTQLTRRIQAGNRRAEKELIEYFSRFLQSLLQQRTHDPDIAKDCCQQAWLIALTKLRAGEIRQPDKLVSFLKHTANNVAITHFRKERRYAQLKEGRLPAPANTYEAAAKERDSEIIRSLLLDALGLLAVVRDREILLRFYLQGEEKTALRHDLGLSSAHFDRVLYRAKNRLRQALEKHEELRALFLKSLH